MRFETVSLIISAFMSGSFGIAALIRNWRNPLCLKFAIFCAVLLSHEVLGMLASLDAYHNATLHLFVTLALGPALLRILEEVVPGEEKFIQKWIAAYVPVFIVFYLLLSFQERPRLEESLLAFSHFLFLVPALVWLFLLAKREQHTMLNRERIRLRYLMWGGNFVLIAYLTNVFHYGLDVTVPALGTLAHSLYLFFIFQTLIQKELITSEELLSKSALFGSIAVTLSTIYMLLTSWVAEEQGLFLFTTLIASFVIIILFDPIRKVTSLVVRKFLLEEQLLLERELENLSRDLVGVVDSHDIFSKVHGVLKRGLGIEVAALYLLERDGLSYSSIGSHGMDQPKELSSSDALIEYMSFRRGRPFVLETIENDKASFYSVQHQKFCEGCLETMRRLRADFIIPFVYEGRAIGFCAVMTGERITLSNEQLRLFIPVARQLAHLLKNTQVFNFLRDRDKLVAVGEMAAGLAHEIKNPLGAIKGAAELLKDEKDNPEYLKIITDEADRLSRVLSDFLDYAKPRRPDHGAVTDPVRIIEHTANLVLRESKVAFELEADKGFNLSVDPEALKQVLLNLFLNAVQAMEDVPQPKLKVTVREMRPKSGFALENLPLFKVWEGWQISKSKYEPFVEIRVSDCGKGIDPADSERIFTPFFTTRTKGTGLGLAICQRLIEGMGGSIQVRPNSPTGATFILHLPIRRKESPQPVRMKEAFA